MGCASSVLVKVGQVDEQEIDEQGLVYTALCNRSEGALAQAKNMLNIYLSLKDRDDRIASFLENNALEQLLTILACADDKDLHTDAGEIVEMLDCWSRRCIEQHEGSPKGRHFANAVSCLKHLSNFKPRAHASAAGVDRDCANTCSCRRNFRSAATVDSLASIIKEGTTGSSAMHTHNALLALKHISEDMAGISILIQQGVIPLVCALVISKAPQNFPHDAMMLLQQIARVNPAALSSLATIKMISLLAFGSQSDNNQLAALQLIHLLAQDKSCLEILLCSEKMLETKLQNVKKRLIDSNHKHASFAAGQALTLIKRHNSRVLLHRQHSPRAEDLEENPRALKHKNPRKIRSVSPEYLPALPPIDVGWSPTRSDSDPANLVVAPLLRTPPREKKKTPTKSHDRKRLPSPPPARPKSPKYTQTHTRTHPQTPNNAHGLPRTYSSPLDSSPTIMHASSLTSSTSSHTHTLSLHPSLSPPRSALKGANSASFPSTLPGCVARETAKGGKCISFTPEALVFGDPGLRAVEKVFEARGVMRRIDVMIESC